MTDLGTTVHLLANPSARQGSAAARIAEITEALGRRGLRVVQVFGRSGDDMAEAALRTVREGCSRMIVAGGDGMVHIAVQAVAGTDTVLGIVPIGTGNDFAGALGLPTAIEAAVATALMPGAPIDLLRIGDRWAASIVTLGFSADVNARANAMRWPKGSSRYSLATVIELRTIASQQIDLRLDDDARTVDTSLLTIANTSDFGGSMRISPDADPHDGVADLTVVGPVGRARLLWFFRRVFSGSHMALPEVTSHRARTVAIETPGIELWADGEPVGTTPATVEVVENALHLAGIVPT